MKQKKSPVTFKKQIISVGFLVLLIGVTYFAINQMFDNKVTPRSLFNVIRELDGKWLVPAFVCVLLYILFEGMSISTIASSLGDKVSVSRGTVYASADLYFSAITPSATGGQPASVYYMTKRGGGISRATTTMIVNVIMYTLSLFFFVGLVLIFNPSVFFNHGSIVIILSTIGVLVGVLLLVFCLALMFSKKLIRKLGFACIVILCKLRIFKNKNRKMVSFNRTLVDYRTCVQQIRHIPKALCLSFIYNVLHRLCYFSISYFIYRSFGLNDFSFFELISIQVVTVIAVSDMPIPGATGVTEMVLLKLMLPVYRKSTQFAVVITRFISNYFCYLLCGIISFIEQLSINREKTANVATNSAAFSEGIEKKIEE